MVRTQLYLEEMMHARLRQLAKKQGRTVSDLVRDALDRAYGRGGAERKRSSLRAMEGMWQDREDMGKTAAYVRRLRRDTHRSRREKS